MGATSVHAQSNGSRHFVFKDIEAIKALIQRGQYNSKTSIGLELEGCGTLENGEANLHTWDIIEKLQPTERFSFQGEVGAHNFEVNFSPVSLSDINPFKSLEMAQTYAINHITRASLRPILCGIFLPFRRECLGETDNGLDENRLAKILNPGRPRYREILHCWKNQVGDSHLHVFKGHSQSIMHTFLIEVLMTSQHIHLSISPDQISDALNIASMISAVCQAPFVSSSRFLGTTGTWEDYRYQIWRQCFPRRTGMGPGWILNLDDYFNKIMKYDIWLSSNDQSDSLELVESGRIPNLSHLTTFQGCLWWDTRPKFFKDAITIEERTMGSASPFDNVSKAVLWTGLMRYYLKKSPKIWKIFGDFSVCEENARLVSQYGLDAEITWFGKKVKVSELIINELISIAQKGHQDIEASTTKEYFENIFAICRTKKTSSAWIKDRLSYYSDQGLSELDCDLEITKEMQRQILTPVINRF